MTPTYQGPKKPPRLPIELIQAMPAASPAPLRNTGGIAKNGPFEPEKPIAEIDIPTSAQQVPMVMPAMTRPAAENRQPMNRFQRRSFMRSEIRPHVTMAMAPQV